MAGKRIFRIVIVMGVVFALAGMGNATTQSTDVAFDQTLDLLPGFDLDIDAYYPSGGPLRLHLVVDVGDTLAWHMNGQAIVEYPSRLNLHFEGTDMGGSAAMELGLEFGLYIYLDVWVWEGQFNIPGIPAMDFVFEDTQTYTPFLLPGGTPSTITLHDRLDDYIELLNIDLTDFVLPVPGIGGGLSLLLGGELDIVTQGTGMQVNQYTLTGSQDTIAFDLPTDNTLELTSTWKGQITPQADVIVNPGLFVQIPLVGRLTLPTVDINIPIPLGTYPIASDPAATAFALPDIATDVAEIGFGHHIAQGQQVTRTLQVQNTGLHDLNLYGLTISGSSAFEVLSPDPTPENPVTIGPGDTSEVELRLTGQAAETYSAALQIISDDPDEADTCKVLLSAGDLSRQWTAATDHGLATSPAVGPDGTLYSVSDDGLLYALSQAGDEKWLYKPDGFADQVESPAAVGADGTIYVGTSVGNVGHLTAINPDGTLKWHYATGTGQANPEYVDAEPAIGPDGTIYIVSHTGRLFAVYPGGSTRWTKVEANVVFKQVIVGPGETLYLTGYDTGEAQYGLYRLSQVDGQVTDACANVGHADSRLAIGMDAAVYVSGFGLVAVDFDSGAHGCQKWSFTVPVGASKNTGQPVVGPDGTVYVGTDDGHLYALDPQDGSRMGDYATPGSSPIVTAPLVGSDDVIYFGTADSRFYAVAADGALRSSTQLGSTATGSPALETNGSLYFLTIDNEIQALYTQSQGLALSSWPMGRQDLARTACLAPAARFAALPSAGRCPLTVRFVDRSEGLSSTWLWDFGDGTTSTVQNPQHTYAYPGNYTVSLTVQGPAGPVTVTLADVVHVDAAKGYYHARAAIGASPAVGSDGTIYAVTSDGRLHAVVATQGQWAAKWIYPLSEPVLASPLVGPDDTVYVASGDTGAGTGSLFAIHPDGTAKWSRTLNGPVFASPAVGGNGVIYAATQNGFLHAILDAGTSASQRWVLDLAALAYQEGGKTVAIDAIEINASPAVSGSGVIVLGAGIRKQGASDLAGKILAFHDAGTVPVPVAQFPPDDFTAAVFVASPALDYSDTVYAATQDGTVYAVQYDQGASPPEVVKWSYALNTTLSSSPVIGPDGTIYIGGQNGRVYALNNYSDHAAVKWFYETGNQIVSTPAVGADGSVYVGSQDYYFYSLAPSDGSLNWRQYCGGQLFASPAIGPGGEIYVGTGIAQIPAADGYLLVLQADSDGPAASPWPMFRHDAMRTGAMAVLARFKAAPHFGRTPLTVQFTENTIGAVSGWHWDFGDGATSTQPDPSHTYATAGTYDISLQVDYTAGGSAGTHTWDCIDCITVKDTWDKWSFATGGDVRSTPAIGPDGTVYVGSADGNLYALIDQGGRWIEKWVYPAGGQILDAPSIDIEETVYFGTTAGNGRVVAVLPDGSLKWACDLPSKAVVTRVSVPVLSLDEHVYVGSTKGVYGIDRDGTLRQTFEPFAAQDPDFQFGPPAVGTDGTVYVGCTDGRLYALTPSDPDTLDLKWFYQTGGPVTAMPLLFQGILVFGSEDGHLYALQDNGGAAELLADMVLGTAVSGSVVVGLDNVLYVGATIPQTIGPDRGRLYALEIKGRGLLSIKWSFETSGPLVATPAVGDDGTVYCGSQNNRFYALDATTGDEKWSFATGGDIESSPVIGPQGAIYVGSDDDHLYALFSTSSGPANTVWPMYGQNARHQALAIDCLAPVAAYALSVDSGMAPLAVTFSDRSTGAVTRWTWNFGDGQTSQERNPTHVYTQAGTYTATLSVYGPCGTDVFALPIEITPDQRIWTATGLGKITCAATVRSADQRIYIGSHDGHVYAIDAAGDMAWAYTAGSAPFGPVTLATDGILYFGAVDGKLYALADNDTTAELQWTFQTGGPVTSPALGLDGTLYAASADGKVYAINTDGTRRWAFDTAGAVPGPPLITADHLICFGASDGSVYAIDPDGHVQWRCVLSGAPVSSGSVGPDGTVYLGADNGRLYALTPDGEIDWQFSTGGAVTASAVVATDGTIYCAATDQHLYALFPDGIEKWRFQTGDAITAAAVVDAGGNVYVGSTNGFVYAIESGGQQIWACDASSPVHAALVMDSDGTLIAGTDNGSVHTLASAGSGPTDSAWPMLARDPAHSGTLARALVVRRMSQRTQPQAAFTINLDLLVADDTPPEQVTIREYLPSGLTLVATDPAHTAFDPDTGLLEWTVTGPAVFERTFSYTVQETCAIDQEQTYESSTVPLDPGFAQWQEFFPQSDRLCGLAIKLDQAGPATGDLHLAIQDAQQQTLWHTVVPAADILMGDTWLAVDVPRIAVTAGAGHRLLVNGGPDTAWWWLAVEGYAGASSQGHGDFVFRVQSPPDLAALQGDISFYDTFDQLQVIPAAGDPGRPFDYPLALQADPHTALPLEAILAALGDIDGDGAPDLVASGNRPQPLEFADVDFGNPGCANLTYHNRSGSLYRHTGEPGLPGDFMALGPDGSIIWQQPAVSDAVIGPDGTAYILADGMSGSGLYALNPDNGQVSWSLVAEGLHDLFIGGTGGLFVGQDRDLLHLDSDSGTEAWRYDTGFATGFQIAHNLYAVNQTVHGVIYVVGGQTVCALNPGGTLQWQNTGCTVDTWAVATDGTLYRKCDADARVYAYTAADGTLTWSRDFGLTTTSFVLKTTIDGAVYAVDDDPTGTLVVFDAQGELKWHLAYGGLPAWGGDGTLYLGSGQDLRAFGPDGDLRWQVDAGSDICGLSAAGPGTVYLEQDGGALSGYSTLHTVVYDNQGGDLSATASTNLDLALQTAGNGNLAWADYDLDGDLDLAVSGQMGNQPRLTFFSNHAGSLAVDSRQPVLTQAGRLAWGDLDNDGDLDLAVSGLDAARDAVLRVLPNEHGLFDPAQAIDLPPVTGGGLAWADYDGDGDADLAVSGFHAQQAADGVVIYQNQDSVLAVDTGQSIAALSQSDLAWIDVDSDGDPDLVVCGFNTQAGQEGPQVVVYTNHSGLLVEDQVLTGHGPATIASGDMDNDGDLDVILAGRFATVSTLLRNDAGTLVPDNAFTIDTGNAPGLAVADLDQDGDLDLVAGNDLNETVVWRNGSAHLAPNTPPVPPVSDDAEVSVDSVVLSWHAAADQETDTALLSYNLRVGTVSGAGNIMSATIPPGPGNAGQRGAYTLTDLAPGRYFWRVQAIDAGFAPSPWTAEQTFTIARFSGDVNGDFAVGLADAVAALQVCAAIATQYPVSVASDVNQDGRVGMPEAVFALQTAAGLRSGMTALTVSPVAPHLLVGDRLDPVATAVYTDGTLVDVSDLAGWSIDDLSVARFGDDGLVAALTPGPAVIQATYAGLTATTVLTVSAVPDETYRLKVIPLPLTGGTISCTPDQPTYTPGQSVSIEALPDAAFTFSGWTGDVSSGDNPLSVTMNSDQTLAAQFTKKAYTLTLVASDAGIDPPTGGGTVFHGEARIISAPAAAGFIFNQWVVQAGTGVTFFLNDPTLRDTAVTLTAGDAVIRADYTPLYTLQLVAGPHGTVDNETSQIVPAYLPVPITATPDAHYHFDQWTVASGDGVWFQDGVTAADTYIALTTGDATVQADFAIDQYTLTIQSGPGGSTTASSITVDHGQTVTVTALPAAGFAFENWSVVSGSGVTVANPSSTSTGVTLTGGNATIRANFNAAVVTGNFYIDGAFYVNQTFTVPQDTVFDLTQNSTSGCSNGWFCSVTADHFQPVTIGGSHGELVSFSGDATIRIDLSSAASASCVYCLDPNALD